MNNSYKITLLVTIVLCGIILGYYIFQDDHKNRPSLSQSPDVAMTPTDTASGVAPGSADDLSTRTLRDGLPGSSDSASGPGRQDLVTPPPPATDGGQGSLLDSVNAHTRQAQQTSPGTSDSVNHPNAQYNTSPVVDPRSLSDTTPPSNGSFTVAVRPPVDHNIPDTGRAALKPVAPTTGRTYTIKSGDNFSTIAQKVLGDASKYNEIAEANPYVDPLKLKVGQVIRLPDPNASANTGRSSTNSIHRPAGRVEYVVRSGDTLSGIAKMHYGSSKLWDVIFRANKSVIGQDPTGIRPGMKLVIPPDPQAAH